MINLISKNFILSDIEGIIFDKDGNIISAAQEGNPEMKNFETSIFDGNYICGSVTEEYLMNLEVDRKDANKSPTKGLIN